MRFGIEAGISVDHHFIVPENPLTTSKLHSLKQLIDDPSPSVQDAVLRELTEMGEKGTNFIQKLCTSDNLEIRYGANQIAIALEKNSPEGMFRDFINSLNYELETGFFLMSRIHTPDLDISECMNTFDEMAHRCKILFTAPMNIRDKCRILNRVLFHEYGFTGNKSDYGNPENSFLQPLIEKRKGIPISLSIIYLLIAQRLEMNLEPVGIPGRFMVGCYETNEPFFIDVFDNGVFRTFEEVATSIKQSQIEPDLGLFAPCTTGEVICRCCRNLKQHYTQASNLEKAELFLSFVHEFESQLEKKSSK